MTPSDLPNRCLALTGSFETGQLPPACFSSLAGDFDGQGLSFSCLQWNLGQGTLQPLLDKMYATHPEVMVRCFGPLYEPVRSMLGLARPQQLAWARANQQVEGAAHVINPQLAEAFALLGSTPEWRWVAVFASHEYFDRALCQAETFGLKSDRAIALLFDCAVQNGGVNDLAMHHVLDSLLPDWGEPGIMRSIAGAVANSANPKYRQDVLARKMCIANGTGMVHGVTYDLANDFNL